jgi:trans-aconitate methyltransferase
MKNWNESAKIYAEIAPKISFYQQSAAFLLQFADSYEAENILDLGCGSSACMEEEILQRFSRLKKLYCSDFFELMLQELEKKLKNDRIVFLQSDAAEIDKKLPEKVELIVANNSFWHFDVRACLSACARCLRDGGTLAFNMPEFDVDFGQNMNEHAKYSLLNEVLREKNLPPKPHKGSAKKYKTEDILTMMQESGFKNPVFVTHEIATSAEDWLNFYRIPTIIQQSLPHLPEKLAFEIYRETFERIDASQLRPLIWVYFKAEKNA